MKSNHIVLVAGEASGDYHGADLVNSLKTKAPSLTFSGVGGEHMEKAGVTILNQLAKHGVTGATEVVKKISLIRHAFYQLVTHLEHEKPALVILIDFPGFNLRLAKKAKALGLKVLYYISPQVWAWKKNRVHHIKKYVDMMAVILPFEKEIYQKVGVPVRFVGHPLTNICKPSMPIELIKEKYSLPNNKKLVGLLPGSRSHEIKKLLPVMLEAAQKLQNAFNDDIAFILPVASTLDKEELAIYLKNTKATVFCIKANTIDLISCCHCVIVASGTASFECALLKKPMVIVYKASLLSYVIAMQVINVKYLGLVNLLSNQMLMPELLQADLNAEAIFEITNNYLHDETFYHHKVIQLEQFISQFAKENIDCELEQLVLELINKNKKITQAYEKTDNFKETLDYKNS